MKKLLTLSFLPVNTDVALLLFRIWVSLSLFIRHGLEKFERFSEFANSPQALDPLHIGAFPTLVLATFADGVGSILIMLGLFTRQSAFLLTVNLLVVFFILNGGSFMKDKGEIVYLYLGSYLFLLLTGAGKYSLDNRLANKIL